MAVYVFGDIHGTEEYYKILPQNFKEASNLTRNDVVIVLGDFGIPFITHAPNWYLKQSDKTAIKRLSTLSYTLLFVDGNHDNHNFWRVQCRQSKFGGKVQKLPGTDNVFHLMRGEYYTIQGKTFWVMGGASSHDIEFRTYNKNWWPGEIPSNSEFAHGLETLANHENRVDYILTHTVPENVLSYLNNCTAFKFDDRYDAVSRYLDTIASSVCYKEWLAGHLHIDLNIPDFRLSILYNNYIRLL